MLLGLSGRFACFHCCRRTCAVRVHRQRQQRGGVKQFGYVIVLDNDGARRSVRVGRVFMITTPPTIMRVRV